VIKALMEALTHENHLEIHQLQDKMSKLEHQADRIKLEIREYLARCYLLPVNRADLEGFLGCQEKMADYAKDFSVILVIRKTRLHPSMVEMFFAFVDQVVRVSETLLAASTEIQNLAEVSFGGAEAKLVMEGLAGIGEEEWKADRLARALSREIYNLEKELEPLTIIFYEKMLLKLSSIANEAENAGDMLRNMIVSGEVLNVHEAWSTTLVRAVRLHAAQDESLLARVVADEVIDIPGHLELETTIGISRTG